MRSAADEMILMVAVPLALDIDICGWQRESGVVACLERAGGLCTGRRVRM